MKVLWNPVDGFNILPKYFNAVIVFMAFTENNIFSGNALDLFINVILKTRVFHIQYKELRNLPGNNSTLVSVLEWWGKMYRIENKITKLAGNLGTGTQYGQVGAQQGVADSQFETYEKMTKRMDVNQQAV